MWMSLLTNECYEDADRFTSSKLRELAGAKAVKNGMIMWMSLLTNGMKIIKTKSI